MPKKAQTKRTTSKSGLKKSAAQGVISLSERPERTFVVGDLHGCHQELGSLFEFLTKDEGLTSNDLLVFIGDYVDRGPHSKETIDLLIEIKKEYPATILLRGNHEDMLLGFIGLGGSLGEYYLANGGEPTLKSYGVTGTKDPEKFLAAIPEDHLALYQGLARYVVTDDHVIVHAGLNPHRGLMAQIDDDIYWIRGDFIGHPHNFEKTVIFGHTPYRQVFFDFPYKIGIDTGAVFGNKLTCLELSTSTVYQVTSGAKEVIIADFKWPLGEDASE